MRWIIEKANEIREKYGIDDLELLASKLGAEVVEIPLGRIIKEMYIKDEGVIVVDPNLHPYKKRHLIAHALAHHLFHRKDKVNYFLEGKENGFNEWLMRKHEKEAEVFAAYLLIPEDKLNELLKQEWVKESQDPVPELAEEFQVSENFMRKRLVRETLPLAGTPYVEMPAVMAKYNPFAEKAGMQKIIEQPPPKDALAIAETLSRLGFNIHLLGSEKYVLSRLQSLSEKEIQAIKEAFIKHCHARFMKCFFCHMPFGLKEAYAKEVRKASIEMLIRLIKVCGFLMQTKVYLFWESAKKR